jgi:L-fuconolactonase
MDPKFKNIPRIDTHLHLWDTDRLTYAWLESVPAIKKSFFIEDYQQQTHTFNIKKMIFVQCECRPDQYQQELEFITEQASKDNRIQGIITYAPLEQGLKIKPVLESFFKDNALIKGVRRMYDDNPGLLMDPSFVAAVQLLPSYNLHFEISIKPALAAQTIALIKSCPDTQFVLNHLGKPDIKNNAINEFKRTLDTFAALPNVVAKISGLITEADWGTWENTDIEPYVTHAITSFGFDRLMFGGDWPVVLLAGSYHKWLTAFYHTLAPYTEAEIFKIGYANAARFYGI